MKVKKQESVRFFNLPELPCVQAVHGANLIHEFSRHVHKGFSIGIVLNGERVIERYGISTTISKRDVFVINPGEAHACKSRGKMHSYFTICVDPAYMNVITSQISGKDRGCPYFRNILLRDTDLYSKIWRFFSLVENAGSNLEEESVLFPLLSTLILRYGDKSHGLRPVALHTDAINRALEYIQAHYAQAISLKQLARVACLSPFYFQRLFLEHTGISPHDCLIQFRIKKARELLAEGQNIVGAALETGFVDQSHFNRSFKRITGTTPGCYLQAVKSSHWKKNAVDGQFN